MEEEVEVVQEWKRWKCRREEVVEIVSYWTILTNQGRQSVDMPGL
jgi:hypothetical protein